MFVGKHRQAEVERLVQLFDRARLGREPALVVYVSPPGWGKTRIVQEFYGAIAARQPAPAFWPPVIAAPKASGQDPLTRVTVARKVVRHREPFVPPAGAAMPWLWLAPTAGRLSDGTPAPALPGLAEQLDRYLPFALGPSGPPDPTVDEAQERGQKVVNLLHQLRTVDAEPMPTVLVLDDAHDLDTPTAELVADLLAAELPVLMVATTWPECLGTAEPFPALLAETYAAGRITTMRLGCLSDDSLVSLLRNEYPHTDPWLCDQLAIRASGNPYALRLLLAIPRVARSITDGRIALTALDIGDLSGRLDQLLHAHWQRLPVETRQLLAAAALLGPAFMDGVLGAGVRQLGVVDSVDHALAMSWLRLFGGDGRLLEFCEQLRYDLAKGEAPSLLSTDERQRVRENALRATRALLPAEPDGPGRAVLLTLHLTLARAGIERDVVAAAASAMELAERALAEVRRPAAIEYLRQAQRWLEDAGEWGLAVECLVELAAVIRIEHRRGDSEPVAARAVELADRYLSPDDERQISARLALAGARRRRRDPAAYESCGQLLAEATDLFDLLVEPSTEVRYKLWSMRLSKQAADGDYAGAAEGTERLVEFCKRNYGPLHRKTLGNLADLGYRLQRCRPDAAIAVRRELLAHRLQLARFADQLQTVSARIDMVIALLSTGEDEALPEAEQLIEEAVALTVRVYGMDAPRSMRVRVVRARVLRRRGLSFERAGDPEQAVELYRRAAAETRHVLETRRSGAVPVDDAEVALGLQRHGESLAYLRDRDAIPLLDEALRIRELDLRQDASFWEVQACANALRWSYVRLGRPRDALQVAGQYTLAPNTEPPPP